MTHHLDLVRTNVASIETELHQRASLLAADNSRLRGQLEAAKEEATALRRRLSEAEAAKAKANQTQQALTASERENRSLKQTLRYLQQELVKAGKKV